MNKFNIGDEVIRKEGSSSKGIIVSSEDYFKNKTYHKISNESYCIKFENNSTICLLPGDDIKLHPDYVKKLRDMKLNKLL